MRLKPSFGNQCLFSSFNIKFAVIVAASVLFFAGCGSGGNNSSAPQLSGNTSVTLLSTSTANDQLSAFGVVFNSITLTSQSGKTVNLLSASQSAEFIHVNARAEPLLTVSIPQGIYTSATAIIGGSIYTCVTLAPSSGAVAIAASGYGNTPSSDVTVKVPEPITITGPAMGLSLDMLVSQSASFSSCYNPTSPPTYSITPTFNLTSVAFTSPFAENGLDGEVLSVNTTDNSFSLALPQDQTLSINTSNGTVYQGINGFSLLSPGTFVDLDAAIQADGSQLATRIAVEDPDTSNLSMAIGPVLFTSIADPVLNEFIGLQQGSLDMSIWNSYSFGDAVFQISGRFTNLQDLPFVASFNGANVFAGQKAYITTHATKESPEPIYIPATTVTLIPQTINGTINGVSSDGSFTTYTVTLAPYDLIATLAVQSGQATALTNPNTVIVYVDGNTQTLNAKSPTAGGVFRFNGLLFNDNGTLRMDCGQITDGVAE